MAKVYCKNCKWFKEYEDCYGDVSQTCKRETGNYIKDFIDGDYKEIVSIDVGSGRYPNDRTENGCKYYHRKWWKVWIK